MIGEISRSARGLVLERDLFGVAAALLIALTAFYFLQSLVEGLIGPAIAAIFSKPGLYSLDLTINGAEFSYGRVIAGLILLGLAFLLVGLLSQARRGRGSSET